MQKYSQNNHHQTNTKKKRRNPTKKNQTATKRNRGTPKKQQKAIKKGYENPSKNIRVVLWNETHRFEKPPRRFGDYINNKLHKNTTAGISVGWGSAPSRAAFSGYNSHAAKVRTRSKPPNKIKKKVEFNHKKVEKQAKRLQERAKNRSETNKRATPDPGANPDPGAKKRGVCPPQKIYASFCEIEPIVLKKQPHRFADYRLCGFLHYT